MLRKAIIAAGIVLSLILAAFAVYDYRQAGPIASDNLRGLALSISAAVENLAVHDPSCAALAKFHPADLAYIAVIDSYGRFRFHSNPDLIGRPVDDAGLLAAARRGARLEERVTLGTGEAVFQFTTPLYLPREALTLRLSLHTYHADAVLRRAKVNITALFGLLLCGWLLAAALIRFARREELHQMENARQETLAKLGEMGAVLAHEIRNPLSGIKGFAQVMAKRPDDARNSGFAQNIVTEAIRLENLVSDLLAYAATERHAATTFGVGPLIEDTVTLVAADARELAVQIETVCSGQLQVTGWRDRLEQALLNLVTNALQAMPDGGVLTVRAILAGSDVVITVEDSGQGICAEALPKIFEPFFTTKARGTGLGLTLCKKIVEEHGGTILLQSVVDQGSTVTVTLPRSGGTSIGVDDER